MMTTPEKHDARRQPGEVGNQNASEAQVDSTSTATEEQRRRIVSMLRPGRKTTLDFRRSGVMQSSTRIFELRKRGYDIRTIARVTIADPEGYLHERVAVYELHGEPDSDDMARPNRKDGAQ